MTLGLMRYVRFHREQARPNSCVPACVCMVLDRVGTPASEDDVRERWQGSKKGYALLDGASFIGATYYQLDPDDPNNYSYLRAMIRDGRWVIAQMFTPQLRGIPPAFGRRPSRPHGSTHQRSKETRHDLAAA